MPSPTILIVYTTNSGSTEQVAQAIAEELAKAGAQAEVKRLEQVTSLEPYAAVVVGAPMILGWHRRAREFVRQHQPALSSLPVAYFLTAMSLTQTGEAAFQGVPIDIDPGLAKPPARAGRLGLRERYAMPSNYLGPVLAAAPQVRPRRIAIFGGRLELFRLKFLQMLFVMLVIRAQAGDLRNWDFIRSWAAGLPSALFSETPHRSE